ncbi:MAG: hypothetical protein K0R57_6039 [Paenibacillaceae bacterium]|jgi:hypothetical protein|nr:hypothetical protein [Paenibacillaceae bacterium]
MWAASGYADEDGFFDRMKVALYGIIFYGTERRYKGANRLASILTELSAVIGETGDGNRLIPGK